MLGLELVWRLRRDVGGLELDEALGSELPDSSSLAVPLSSLTLKLRNKRSFLFFIFFYRF